MKHTSLLLLTFLVFACNQPEQNKMPVTDNAELNEIYTNDQADRQSGNIDWELVSKRDKERQQRVLELLDSNKVVTATDYNHAAMVFQHGGDSIAYGMAVKLMKKAVALDSTASKWLLAAAIDRYLLSKDEPQVYGTQYSRKNGEPWALSNIDTTKITDEELMEFGVRSLAQQRERVIKMNLKDIFSLQEEGLNTNEIIAFIESNDSSKNEYDFSESAINRFGYSVMKTGEKEEALKIFKLNTQLFPNAFNAYDSYGECLMALGKKEEALVAYKKSLELNPANKNAEKIINQYTK
jgi:tetratricopeptide (TPR) repeat protein